MSSRSLLLIDADPAVHQLLTKLLEREDRSIQDVYDGSEALALLRRSHFIMSNFFDDVW